MASDPVGKLGRVELEKRLLDPNVQWKHAKDVWQNPAIPTAIHMMATPIRWVGKKMSKKK